MSSETDNNLTLLLSSFSCSGEHVPQLPLEPFDLWWNLPPLVYGLQAVLSEDHPLLAKARRAEADKSLAREVWQEVDRLPYETVQRMIRVVSFRRGLWELEDYLEGNGD